MKNFAMLGKWHVHAEGYAKELNALPDCRVAGVWDADAEAAKKWAETLGCRASSIEDILDDKSIDGVVICNATNEHAPLMIRACDAGKAVFTEKVLALSTDEALAIQAAVVRSHTRFAISFPHLSNPRLRLALEIARSGKLGRLTYARVRNVHDGAVGDWLPPHFYDPIACGGGAMVDLGAHPMYTLCALLGEPIGVQSAFVNVTGHAVEDNAVSVLRFEGGALGVSETGFVSRNNPYTFEVSGTEGALMLHGDEVRYCCPDTGRQWAAAETTAPAPPSPLAQWAGSGALPDDFGIEAAVRLTRVMEAAYRPAARDFATLRRA